MRPVIRQDLSAQRLVAERARQRGQLTTAAYINEYIDHLEQAVEILEVLGGMACDWGWKLPNSDTIVLCELSFHHAGNHEALNGAYSWGNRVGGAFQGSPESENAGATPASGNLPTSGTQP